MLATVKQLDTLPIMDEYAVTKVTTMGHITEVTTRQKNSSGTPCIKIDKDHYVDTRTGEVLEYQHIENIYIIISVDISDQIVESHSFGVTAVDTGSCLSILVDIVACFKEVF